MTLSKHFFTHKAFCAVLSVTSFTLAQLDTISVAQVSKVPNSVISSAAANYDKLPLSFEANQGQTDPSVRFLSRGPGYSIFLTDSSALLALGHPANCGSNTAKTSQGDRQCQRQDLSRPEVVKMTLAGASKVAHPQVIGQEPLPGKVNYFIGKDPTQWRSNLPTFAEVRYGDVFPGIDLVYYGNRNQLEYDFVVEPGADSAQIRLNFTGEKQLSIAADGDMILQGSYGRAIFKRPLIYQQKDGKRQVISGRFLKTSAKSVGFSIGAYDHKRPLIIDPVLVYSTYLGGSGFIAGSTLVGWYGDQANGIAVDAEGNAYLVGTTFSENFPVTNGAYQTKDLTTYPSNGTGTVFVSKFNVAGTELLYSTYLGGTVGEVGAAIAIDANNNAYVAGLTSSGDFPVTSGAFDTVNHSSPVDGYTGFVTKLNPTGSGLEYSTFLGGSLTSPYYIKGDAVNAIAVDSLGDAYVSGTSFTPDFPVTTGAFQPKNAGSNVGSNSVFSTGPPASNGFVAKINPTGAALLYATYLGGSGVVLGLPNGGSEAFGDQGNAIAIDSDGNAYITGTTYSSNFPITSGAFQKVYPGTDPPPGNQYLRGIPNAFVTKVNPTGTGLVYSTYLGGSGIEVATTNWEIPDICYGDQGFAISVDSSGDAYIAGSTYSLNFPVTAGVLSTTGDNSGAGFVTKLNAMGSAPLYSTFIGGDGASVAGLAIDAIGNAYLAGTAMANFPETPNTLSQTGGPFVAKLNSTATALEYNTLLQDIGKGSAIGLALDSSSNAYVTGFTSSTNFPTTSGAFQTVNNAAAHNGTNAFVSKLALSGETTDYFGATVALSAYPPLVNKGQPVTLTATVTGATGSTTPAGAVTFSGKNLVTTTRPLNASGVATFTSTPPVLGSYSAYAGYGGDATHLANAVPSSNPATFQVVVVGPAATLKAVSGLNQKSRVYGVPFSALSVLVSDSNGYPVEGATVTFTGAGLAFAPASAITNAIGIATTLPNVLMTGNLTAVASVSGLSQAVTFPLAATKAPLYISARNVTTTYGQTPPQPTAYTLTGFVNGDTANVVSGAPVLSTTVTSTTPVGFYKIGVLAGTLAATNYYFDNFSSGEGSVGVYRAPLEVTVNNLTMTQGSPVPLLTYSLTGFVNGETAGTTVTGAAVLATTATPASKPGNYPITFAKGTLAANNYYFTGGANGVLTVLP